MLDGVQNGPEWLDRSEKTAIDQLGQHLLWMSQRTQNEPASEAWEAPVLPLYDARSYGLDCSHHCCAGKTSFWKPRDSSAHSDKCTVTLPSALESTRLLSEYVVGPTHRSHGPGKSDRCDGQDDHVTNFSGGNPGGLRVAHGGVHGSFRLGGGGDSNFDESPNAVIQRPSAVTVIIQFLH